MARLGAIPVNQDAASSATVEGTTLHARSAAPHPLYNASKRLLDLSLSLVLFVVALPLMCLASVAIVLTTRQHPLFLQTRIGEQGREFSMLKLRTMKYGDEPGPEEPASGVVVLLRKSPDDVRVTRIGRFLRRTSIDELPQLVNVLAGRMSLVGPRPSLPAEVAEYPDSWRMSLIVKPGLTGLWQVSGRSELSPRRRAALDRVYLRRRSLTFDALILLRTISATVSMRGAW